MLRREIGGLQDELRDLTDTAHRDEVARTQQRLRIEPLQAKAVEELGIDPEALVEEFGPHQLVPHVVGRGRATSRGEPRAVRARGAGEAAAQGRARAATLGRVNPLALEEFAALEERHKFLTTQLEDLKRSKRDLLDIVKEVDERVEQVFTEAFHDTAAQFERVFERLFPGGEGRLVLTDPDNMLTTGIEVEARPPGKKIKRLSLLSGGERSLVAVALLVAIFKARPSPFYIMDEVEAALDDTNLGRLSPVRGAARLQPAHRHHPPEAHDGGRRRAVRRVDARRRRHHRRLPADPRRGRRALGLTGRTARTPDRRSGRSRRREPVRPEVWGSI